MKIKSSDYLRLKELMIPLGGKIKEHRDFLVSEGKYKDLSVRLAWDIAFAAKAGTLICNDLYPYLNDTHITTALKKAIVEIEAEFDKLQKTL
jgi:hypothetical protein